MKVIRTELGEEDEEEEAMAYRSKIQAPIWTKRWRRSF